MDWHSGQTQEMPETSLKSASHLLAEQAEAGATHFAE
jgi:hypothetical protein